MPHVIQNRLWKVALLRGSTVCTVLPCVCTVCMNCIFASIHQESSPISEEHAGSTSLHTAVPPAWTRHFYVSINGPGGFAPPLSALPLSPPPSRPSTSGPPHMPPPCRWPPSFPRSALTSADSCLRPPGRWSRASPPRHSPRRPCGQPARRGAWRRSRPSVQVERSSRPLGTCLVRLATLT